ncbi:cupin domain-containing protein [Paenibacillus qinlingensis]|uniref:RmlC-like cupin family protein n=1 Tax=Paenibacillus qinlingensis TaxID=1837343 RepID=A0ABU1NQW1_9BACL|nr:cupin domain-containing protein [Paenibacillus qinlingensis]MDR6549866.1 putative RmlC-like cupin family protein [Paenibacillus qinlingensis]
MDNKRTCRLIRSSRTYHGKQGFDYHEAISKESADSQGICMMLLTILPGQRAKAHLHQNHETTIYMMEGKSCMWYGENLEQHMELEQGDFLYIPAGMPHLPYNPSTTDICTCVLARTDPNEQESVLLLPELDALWDSKKT